MSGVPQTEPAESREARGSLGTVRNAVVLLELLGEGPAFQQLTDLAERSGMSVPTVHRLLRSLVLADLVEQDPRSSRYSLGPELVRLIPLLERASESDPSVLSPLARVERTLGTR